MFSRFTDWYMGPIKWPEHDRQPEGENNQRIRLSFQSVPDCLHYTGKTFL